MAPSSSGLGRGILSPETGVRLPVGLPQVRRYLVRPPDSTLRRPVSLQDQSTLYFMTEQTTAAWHSISPILMSARGSIQFIAVEAPLRHELVHVVVEPVIMMPLKQVNHLVHQNTLKARRRFLRQLQV